MDYKMDFFLKVISIFEKINIKNIKSAALNENNFIIELSLEVNKEINIFEINIFFIEHLQISIKHCDEEMSTTKFFLFLCKLTDKIHNNYFDKKYFDAFMIKKIRDYYFEKITNKLKGSIDFKFERLLLGHECFLLITEIEKKNINLEISKTSTGSFEINTIRGEQNFKNWALKKMDDSLVDEEKPFLIFINKYEGDNFIFNIFGFVALESYKETSYYKLNCLYDPEYKRKIEE